MRKFAERAGAACWSPDRDPLCAPDRSALAGHRPRDLRIVDGTVGHGTALLAAGRTCRRLVDWFRGRCYDQWSGREREVSSSQTIADARSAGIDASSTPLAGLGHHWPWPVRRVVHPGSVLDMSRSIVFAVPACSSA